MNFELHRTPLQDLFVLERRVLKDERGSFSRLFCQAELAEFGWNCAAVQSNISTNTQIGTIRGMHFQRTPHQEIKLVTCIAGAVFDVAVDMRKTSETFGQWFGAELSAANNKCLLIPRGFAHGFQVLEANSSLIYYHSAAYVPASESGVRWNDEVLDIQWPLAVTNISTRDKDLPSFADYQDGPQL